MSSCLLGERASRIIPFEEQSPRSFVRPCVRSAVKSLFVQLRLYITIALSLPPPLPSFRAMGFPLSHTQSTRALGAARYLVPILLLMVRTVPTRHVLGLSLTSCQVTLHYIRNFSLGGESSASSLSAAERLKAPLGESSTSDLLDLLNLRLGNVSISEDTGKYDPRANAVLIMLSRNSEVNDAAEAVRQMEDRFNNRYHYPWVFLNDEPFSEEFIQCVSCTDLVLHIY